VCINEILLNLPLQVNAQRKLCKEKEDTLGIKSVKGKQKKEVKVRKKQKVCLFLLFFLYVYTLLGFFNMFHLLFR